MLSPQLPYSRVYVNTGDPIEEENLMEFRLLYEGPLFATGGSNTRPAHKHDIRRAFHPQLRRLWKVKTNLQAYARFVRVQAIASPSLAELHKHDIQEPFEVAGIMALSKIWTRAGYDLVPLVTPELSLRCSLDILILRPGENQFVFTQGDLDGQVKTLFDALRIPDSLAEAGGMGPQEDETPFFCLLQDDKLVSEVRVTSDELLMLPHHKQVDANDCFAVIHVRLNNKEARTFDNYFG